MFTGTSAKEKNMVSESKETCNELRQEQEVRGVRELGELSESVDPYEELRQDGELVNQIGTFMSSEEDEALQISAATCRWSSATGEASMHVKKMTTAGLLYKGFRPRPEADDKNYIREHEGSFQEDRYLPDINLSLQQQK